jgi:RNA polymerase sigma-70 factor (ECF subfamily)
VLTTAAEGSAGASLRRVTSAPADERPAAGADDDSRAWLDALTATGRPREEAVRNLHALLLRAARFEVRRRYASLSYAPRFDVADLATQAADDALVSVLARLGDFRGLSRFTTWAYKFALVEAAVKVRRAAWREREVPMAPEDWALLPAVDSADGPVLDAELAAGLRTAVLEHLTTHQREVLLTVVVAEVPIDVLAERLGTTRGALYKTIHDARRKLRDHLGRSGLLSGDERDRHE